MLLTLSDIADYIGNCRTEKLGTTTDSFGAQLELEGKYCRTKP